jgi:hypothetical protein
MKFHTLSIMALSAIAAIAAASPAAAAITITYTGVPFTSVSSTLAGSGLYGYVVLKDFDTSVATLETAADILDWSLSNGAYTLSKSGGDVLTRASFSVAAGGEVTTWFFDAADTGFQKLSQSETEFFDTSVIHDPNAYSGEDQNFGPSGSWTLAVGVPEPSTWAMLLAGFGMLGMSTRRRRSMVAAFNHASRR